MLHIPDNALDPQVSFLSLAPDEMEQE